MSNEIIPSNSKTMSSREIAELTGKRHADVLRDIDRLLETLNEDMRLGFSSTTYVDASGYWPVRPTPEMETAPSESFF